MPTTVRELRQHLFDITDQDAPVVFEGADREFHFASVTTEGGVVFVQLRDRNEPATPAQVS